MAISSSRQRNAVSVGIALGLVERDRVRFGPDNLGMSMAFERAWRGWDDRYKSQFSQVNTDLAKGLNGYIAMTHATETRRAPGIFWRRESNGYEIVGHDGWSGDDWSAEELAEIIDGTVPVAGWIALADAFLEMFDRE